MAEWNADETERCRLGVVIINYRTPDLVKQCVLSVIDDVTALDGRIVIVDNASGDGSVETLTAWLQTLDAAGRVRLIASAENTGFSGGNNIGLRALNADFYLLLNSDTLARAGALKTMAATMAARPEIGALGPRLEDPDGTGQISAFRFHSPISELISGAATGPVTRLLNAFDVPLDLSQEALSADWVSFACVMIRREAIDAVGAMDDGYFMYFEDADYCHALKKAGFAVICDPSARVVHLRGGSSPVKSRMAQKKRPPAYYYASRSRFFRKCFGPLGLFLANGMWYVGRGISYLRLAAGKTPPSICEAQARDIWMNWRSPLRGPSHGPARASDVS